MQNKLSILMQTLKTSTYNSINRKTSIRTKLNNDMTIARETYYYI
jgi:hypothetical protein